jgi:hypothetical protein
MTARATVFLLLLSIGAMSSRAATNERELSEATRAADEMCTWTGLRRVSALRDTPTEFEVDLAVDGKRIHYKANVTRTNGRLKINHLMPIRFDWHDVGLGYDTLKDPEARAVAVKAVQKANAYLRWRWASRPQIQRVGRNMVVSYETVTREQQKKSGYAYLDPYVSFLVTPKGTVFGFFVGG